MKETRGHELVAGQRHGVAKVVLSPRLIFVDSLFRIPRAYAVVAVHENGANCINIIFIYVHRAESQDVAVVG